MNQTPLLFIINCSQEDQLDQDGDAEWVESLDTTVNWLLPPGLIQKCDITIGEAPGRLSEQIVDFFGALYHAHEDPRTRGSSLLVVIDDKTTADIGRWLFSEPRQYILKHLVDRLPESTRSLNLNATMQKPSWLMWILAFVRLFKENGQSVILTRTASPLSLSHIDYVPDSTPPDYWIEAIQDRNVLADFLLTFVGNTLFAFAPTPGDSERHKFVSNAHLTPALWESADGGLSKTHVNVFSRIPQAQYYHDWFRQEFGGRDTIRSFLSLVGRSLGYEQGKANPLLHRSLQFAIGIVRVCRLMSSWTLEGVPFQFTVLFLENDQFRSIGADEKRQYSILFYPEEPIPFNFVFLEKIRDIAEAAQCSETALLVTADDGLLRAVCKLLPGTSGVAPLTGSESRVTRMTDSQPSPKYTPIRICCPPSGLLEIYGRREKVSLPGESSIIKDLDRTIAERRPLELAFWFNGFRWQSRPYLQLERTLLHHLGNMDAIPDIMASVGLLQDRHCSSIILLLHKDDEGGLARVAGKELRKNIILTDGRVSISSEPMSPSILASLLQLDGAHVIDSNGFVCHLCRMIRDAEERYVVDNLSAEEEDLFRDTVFADPRKYSTYTLKGIDSERGVSLIIHEFLSSDDLVELNGTFLNGAKDGTGVADSLMTKIRESVESEMRMGVFQVKKITSRQSRSKGNDSKPNSDSENILRGALDRQKSGELVLIDPPNSDGKEITPNGMEIRGYLVQFLLTQKKNDAQKFEDTLKKLDGVFWVSKNVDDEVNRNRVSWKVFVTEGRFLHLVFGDEGVPIPLKSALRRYYDYGPGINTDSTSGSGRRATASLVEFLPHSAAVKVSSSGSIHFYYGKHHPFCLAR